MATDLLTRVAEHWAAQDYPHAAPAPEAEVQLFEAKYGRRLPIQVRDYFQTLNGGQFGRDGGWDRELINFWRLDQVRTELELRDGAAGSPDLFVFADWSIDAHFYAILLSPEPLAQSPVYIIGGLQPDQVADGVHSFLEAYLRNHTMVLYAARP